MSERIKWIGAGIMAIITSLAGMDLEGMISPLPIPYWLKATIIALSPLCAAIVHFIQASKANPNKPTT